MEFICCCAGKTWRLQLWTHDPESTQWLSAAFEADDVPLPVARQVEPRLWVFEDPHRSLATDADPLIEVHLHWDGPHAEAWVTLEGQETRLDNRVFAVPDPELNGLVRVATPEETLDLALRWFIAHEHLGCREPEELVLWGRLTTATSYVVDDVAAWVSAGTPLPGIVQGMPGLAVFVARTGTFSGLQEALDSVQARYDPEFLGQGVYGEELVRMLLAVGRVDVPA